MKENADTNRGSSLKMYPASTGDKSEWIVSGPSKCAGKRWRRKFENKELAEEFYKRELEKQGDQNEDSGNALIHTFETGSLNNLRRDVGRKSTGSPGKVSEERNAEMRYAYGPSGYGYGKQSRADKLRSVGSIQIGILILCLVVMAYGLDRKFCPKGRSVPSAEAIRSNFEVNPLLAGWNSSGPGAEWTEVEHVTGRAAISVRGASWQSRLVNGDVRQWYRLAFRSKGPSGESVRNGKVVSGCLVEWFDGREKAVDQAVRFDVEREKRWRLNEYWFRTQSQMDVEGNLVALGLKIRFVADERNEFFVDEVVLEKMSTAEVENWAAIFYESFPSPIQYKPADNRWERIPQMMTKLRGHQKVRVIVVGDDIQQDLVSAPIELFIERNYPGCRVELVPSIMLEGGIRGIRGNIPGFTTRFNPDLIVIGGHLAQDDMPVLQELVNEVKANDSLARRRTELLLLTPGWRPTEVQESGVRFSSDMRELNQDVARNAVVPNDVRGELLRFAEKNGIEFLDMMGIISEFIYGAASTANAGPATAADGVPYGFWTRDWIHPAEIGKHLMGRILELYLAPSDVVAQRVVSRDQSLKKVEEGAQGSDRELLIEMRRKFQVSALERPAFLRTFDKEGLGGRVEARGGKSVTFRLGNDERKELGFNFDEPADLRHGDVAVYWSFSSDRAAGEERGKVGMHLSFTDPGRRGRHDRAQVSLIVRPGGVSVLGINGELLQEQSVEYPVEVPVENFVDSKTEAKFRLLLRWTGGDRVVAEAASWSARTKRWEGFTPHDRPGAAPLIMELSILKNFLGTTAFKSIFFEAFSDVPRLGSVLVTVRPSLVR